MMKIKLFENFNEAKGWNGIPVTMDKLKELFDADALKDIRELEDQTGVAVEAKNGVEYDVRFNHGEYLMDVIVESASIKRFENFNESDNDEESNDEVVDGGENIEVEISQDDLDSMADDEDEEVEEAANPLDVTSKDTMRIQDIVRKAAGSEYKAQTLASTMCKLIKDSYKALRRARAAERENQHKLADIFFKRATELGALGA